MILCKAFLKCGDFSEDAVMSKIRIKGLGILCRAVICFLFLGQSEASIPAESPKKAVFFERETSGEKPAFLLKKQLLEAGELETQIVFFGAKSSEKISFVAFLDNKGDCFRFDNESRQMVLCDKADGAQEAAKKFEPFFTSPRGQEEMTVKEFSAFSLPVYFDPLLNQGEALQTAGLGDWICSHKIEIALSLTAGMAIVTGVGTFAGMAAVTGVAVRAASIAKTALLKSGLMTMGGGLTGASASLTGVAVGKGETELTLIGTIATLIAGTATGKISGLRKIIMVTTTGAAVTMGSIVFFCPSIG